MLKKKDTSLNVWSENWIKRQLLPTQESPTIKTSRILELKQTIKKVTFSCHLINGRFDKQKDSKQLYRVNFNWFLSVFYGSQNLNEKGSNSLSYRWLS